MYCVIQKIKNKKVNSHGAAKGIRVTETKFSFNNGPVKILYGYSYTEERFKRPLKYSYKISIHKSYRENGKVKKKQWVLGTLDYYHIAEHWVCSYDLISTKRIQSKLHEMGTTEDELYTLVNEKLDPLISEIEEEFQITEEYKVNKKNNEILEIYRNTKREFENKYGENTYDYCYDVFGELRNEIYLNELKTNYEAQQKYSGYYENSYSNYSNYDFSSYFKSNQSTYTEEEKEYLKAIYKAAALKLHPDIKKDNGDGMKFLNKLKEEWGV